MLEPQKSFKRPSQKHQPRGLSVLYEDRDLLVVDKVSGLLTVSTMIEENVVAAAGVHFSISLDELVDTIKEAGFKPRQRDTLYNQIKEF